MDARDALAKILAEIPPSPFLVATIIEALHASGYSIIHDSENHGPTVERCAELLW